jgi:hypothetical protein
MKNDPRTITVKYPATCAETGKPLPKGSEAVYYPATRKLYHPDSRTASEFRSQAFSRSWGMADSNW